MILGLHTQPHSHIVHLVQHSDGLVLTGLQHTRDPHISQGCHVVCIVDREAEKKNTPIKVMYIIIHNKK